MVLFASKPGMDIKGISEATIRKLYEADLLKSPPDFYCLKEKTAKLLQIEGLRGKSVSNLLNSIELSKKKPFFRLLTALGIPLLGGVKTRKLTHFYSDLVMFIEAIEKKQLDSIGFHLGTETQKEAEKFFQKPKNLAILKNLVKVNFVH